VAVPDRIASERLIRRVLGPVVLLLVAGWAAACDHEPAGLDEDVYVEAVARLTLADLLLFEEERLDSARIAILEELGTSAGELVAFAERHGDDIAYMHGIWTRIRERVDSVENVPPDSIAAPDSGLVASPPP